MPSRKKLTIALSDDLHAELVRRADGRGLTITDLIKGALRLDFFVEDNDARVVIVENGERREVLIR